MEEAQIAVDYIAGSSMGAIIGGLYATGYSAHQLDSIFREVNFSELFNESFSRQQLDFDEKDKRDRYAVRFNFDNNKWTAPSAFASGRAFHHLLHKWLQGFTKPLDFEKLPIPFVCAATDLETGETHYLEAGSLPLAINASAALPTLFQPVSFQGHWLMDGGVSDNYPIDILKAKGVNYIIGVDVQEDLNPRDQLQTAPQILLQIANFSEVATRSEKIYKTDCYIKLPLEDFGLLSFAHGAEIIAEGYTHGKKIIAELDIKHKKFTPQKRILKDHLIQIDRIRVDGLQQHSQQWALGKIRLQTPGVFSQQQWQQGIDRLSATQQFRYLKYFWNPDPTKNEMIVQLEERKKPSEFKLGLHYDPLYASAALVNLNYRHLLFSNDSFSFDMILGDQPRYNCSYSIRSGYSWSFDFFSSLHRFENQVDQLQQFFPKEQANLPEGTFDLRFTDFSHGFRMQRILGEWMQFRLGAAYKDIRYNTRAGVALNSKSKLLAHQKFVNAFAQIKIDKRDDAYFPSKGVWFETQMDQYYSKSASAPDFLATIKTRIQTNLPLLPQWVLQTELSGGISYGDTQRLGFPFIGGGYGSVFVNNSFSFLGFRPWELYGDSFVKIFGQLDYTFSKKHHLNLSYTEGLVDTEIFDTQKNITAESFQSLALGYGYESLLGPCEIKFAQGQKPGEIRVYLALGYRF